MVEISEIEGRESLEAWLKKQPREFSTIIAARCALRVLPIYWEWSLSSNARESGLTPLPVLRSSLIAAVACYFPSASSKKAAAFAAAAHIAAAHAAAAHAAAVAHAAAAAHGSSHTHSNAAHAAYAHSIAFADYVRSGTFSANPHSNAQHAAHVASGVATDIAADMWRNIQQDCAGLKGGLNLQRSTLWLVESPLLALWPDFGCKVLSAENWQPGDWQFWVEWYDQMLDPVSNPPDWELLEQVALIKPEVWDAGPEAVSEAIAAIQLGFAERALATGERFEFDEGRKLFVRNPVAAEDKAMLKYCVDRLSELSDLAESMGNMQGILGGELFFVRRAVENHADNPVMVWDNCGNAMRMLNANLASGACPEGEPYVTILQATLTDVRLRLERDPAVQHVAPHRPEMAPIDDEQAVEVFTGALDLVAEVVEPEVAEEIAQDRATLLDRFAGVGRRAAAFITGAARILAIVVAAIPGKLLGVMDYGVAFSERLQKLTENSGKIAKNIRTVAVSGALGAGAVTTATSPEKIPQAIDMIVKIFGG